MPHIPQWVFYLLSSVFDATTIVISSFFLIKSASGTSKYVLTWLAATPDNRLPIS
jgi:hypothetical protein